MRQMFSQRDHSRNNHQVGAAMIWVILLLGLVGGILVHWYTTPQNAPVWMRGWLPGLPLQTGPLYRWRDAQGRLQISDQPPKDRPYEVVRYRPDANVLPAPARP